MQLRGCNTSREVRLKLENIYASKGPARKATLLKQLTLQRMNEGDDVRNHINKFFNTVEKLSDMNVDINEDLLSIMLLHSLPTSFENFRCAVESRDRLPKVEDLKIKILEEYDARIQKDKQTIVMVASTYKQQFDKKENFKNQERATDSKDNNNKKYNKTC